MIAIKLGLSLMVTTVIVGACFFVHELWTDGERGAAVYVGFGLVGAVVALAGIVFGR